MRTAVLALISLAGGCIIVPPSEASYGVVTAAGLGTGYRTSIGAHSIAADRHDTSNVDLGAGWVREGGRRREAVDGTYVSLARRLPFGPHQRWWLGGRAEAFWAVTDPRFPRRGLTLRAAYRNHLGGVSYSGGSGGAYGAAALGFYADLGGRQLENGHAEVFFSVGLSLDLPAWGAAGKLSVW